MRSKRWLAGALAGGLVAAGVAAGTAATAGTTICGKYGSTRTVGGYVAQNNLWGADTPQCISVSGDGFTLTTSAANRPTNGAPASYPSLFWGCHYGTCTDGFAPIPATDSRFAALTTSVEFGSVDQGAYDASYDIWFDPTARTNGQVTGAELMIWLDHRGGVQPVGSKVGTVRVAGADWDVWFGNIGWNVVSYVRSTPSTRLSTTVGAFFSDAVSRGYARDAWYLTSVQAGFEPWVGGEGLSLASFSVSHGATTAPPTATPPTVTPPTVTPPTATPPTGQPAAGACRVTTRRDEWPGGFVRYLTLTNSSSVAIPAWNLAFRLAPGQHLSNGWNATWQQTGDQVTAGSLAWNARLDPGASVEVGFQGTWSGSDPDPDHWELDGVACTAG